MQEGLKLVITADGSDVIKTFQQLENELKSFQAQLKTATKVDDISRLNQAIKSTQAQMSAFKNIGDPFDKLKRGSGEATQAVVNLSRVAQDAPYGFIGISNNLNPLLESFQRLKASSGSTGAALKALVSDLAGGGGIGLAVGVVSSLLVVFGDRLFGASKKADELADSIGKISDESKNAVENVGQLQSILSSLSNLESIDFKISGKGQVELLKTELDQMKYLQGLAVSTFENERDRDLRSETDYFNQSEENRKKIDEQIKQHNENVMRLSQEAQEWKNKVVLQEKKIQLQELEDKKDSDKKLEEAGKKAQAKQEQLQKEQLQKLKEWQAERSRIVSEFSKDFEGIKIFSLPDVGDPQSNTDLFDRLRKKLVEAADNLPQLKIKLPVSLESNDKFGKPQMSETIIQDMENAKKKGEQMLADLKEQAKLVGAVFNDVVTPSIQSMFEALEAGKNPMQALFKSLGKEVEHLIAKIAAAAAEAAILSAITGGGSSAAGGFGVIFKSLLGFAEGGFVPGFGSGDTVPAMLTPGEYVVPKKFAGLAGALFEGGFGGGKLPLHFANGGTVPQVAQSSYQLQPIRIELTGNSKISGRDIVTSYHQEIKTQKRSY